MSMPANQKTRMLHSIPCAQQGCRGMFDAETAAQKGLTGWWWPTGQLDLEDAVLVHDHRVLMRSPEDRALVLCALQGTPGMTMVSPDRDGIYFQRPGYSGMIDWHGVPQCTRKEDSHA